MEEEGLYTYHWTNSPGDTYSVHSHPYHKVIYVIRGSITFSVSESGDEVVLYSGDRLDLPAGVTHEARVGPQGVACLEGHHET
ncbi:MAG: cupin domain-containing protein [Anaerolineales bacterium]|nr:cupin domain-containing protein [Anaerolineales bacterium]